MDKSLTSTLASKHKMTVTQVQDKYKATFLVDGKSYKGLQIIRHREGKDPLVANWGGIPLKGDIRAKLNDQPQRMYGGRSELEKRLLANTCEYCGDTKHIQAHHIRPLKDLKKYTGRERPEWVTLMPYRHP